MKTIKNVIPLAVAVAFFAALNVQAYFDPSVGRWASRDPITDVGFHLEQTGQQVFQVQNKKVYDPPIGNEAANDIDPNEFLIGGEPNAYCFNKNDAIIFVDPFGLSPFCVCVRANDGHAWISVTDLATGERHTYGRWFNGYPRNAPIKARTSGVNIDVELNESYNVSRCVTLQSFSPTINAGYDLYDNNCTTYAWSEWKRASGENLQKSSIFSSAPTYDYPPVLESSILSKNGGKKSVECCAPTTPKK